MPDAVTLAPGWCLPLVSLFLPVSAVRCHAVAPAQGSCLPLISLSPSLSIDAVTSDARCCDAGCGVVSPACFCGQMLDVVSPACPLCLPVSASDVVAPACLPVSQSLTQKARCCDCGVVSLWCLSLVSCVSQSLRVSGLSPSLCGWLFV